MLIIVQPPAGQGLGLSSIASSARGEKAILLGAAEPVRPWAGARRLLAALRHCLGNDAVERAIAPNRGLLSLVLRNLHPTLSLDEKRRRKRGSALYRYLELFRPSTGDIGSRPITEAFAHTFSRLLAERKTLLVVPSVARLDLETIRLLRILLGRDAGQGIGCVVGNDLDAPIPLDVISAAIFRLAQREMKLFLLLPGTGVETPHGGEAEPIMPEPAGEIDPLDDDIERLAWKTLESSPAPNNNGTLVRAARAAFESFGFGAALRLSQEVLARCPDLTGGSEMHTIAAISAEALLPAGGDPKLAELSAEHYDAALAAETEPARRVQLLYRLSLHTLRYQHDRIAALSFADGTVEVAQSLARGFGQYAEAWARNGRAYVYFRTEHPRKATAECQAALRLLDCPSVVAAVPANEIVTTRCYLTNNLARLAFEQGQWARAHYWYERYARTVAEQAGAPCSTWFAAQLASRNLAVAAQAMARQLAAAQAELDPESEALYAHYLGDLKFRVGDAHAAYENFVIAHRIWDALGDSPGDILTAGLNCAVTAFRAGLLEEAESRFERALNHPLCTEPAQAEIMAAMAMVAARRGQCELTASLSEDALTRAKTAGQHDVLVRVARSDAEAALMLGEQRNALEFCRLALAETTVAEASGETIEPEDVLGVLVCAFDCEPLAPELLAIRIEQSLGLVQNALNNINAWWDLSRLLAHVVPFLETVPEARQLMQNSAIRAALRHARVAAAQRADCPWAVERLRLICRSR